MLNYCFKNCENHNDSCLVHITSYTVKSNLQTQKRRRYDFWLTENNAESQLGQMALPGMKGITGSSQVVI